MTARALFLAAAAEGTTTLRRPLLSDDTDAFAEGLLALGYRVERGPDVWRIQGRRAGPAVAEADVQCRDAATAARFLSALAATGRDWIEMHPGTPVAAEIASHGDHRIAVSFAAASLRTPGEVTFNDPGA